VGQGEAGDAARKCKGSESTVRSTYMLILLWLSFFKAEAVIYGCPEDVSVFTTRGARASITNARSNPNYFFSSLYSEFRQTGKYSNNRITFLGSTDPAKMGSRIQETYQVHVKLEVLGYTIILGAKRCRHAGNETIFQSGANNSG
jgi:hypothetical protein